MAQSCVIHQWFTLDYLLKTYTTGKRLFKLVMRTGRWSFRLVLIWLFFSHADNGGELSWRSKYIGIFVKSFCQGLRQLWFVKFKSTSTSTSTLSSTGQSPFDLWLFLCTWCHTPQAFSKHHAKPATIFCWRERPDPNTGNSMPYSLRIVCGFFNVPWLFANKCCETRPPA